MSFEIRTPFHLESSTIALDIYTIALDRYLKIIRPPGPTFGLVCRVIIQDEEADGHNGIFMQC